MIAETEESEETVAVTHHVVQLQFQCCSKDFN